MDTFLANTFSIAIQPKQNFHFRYVSELRNTHGVITGQVQSTFGQRQTNNNAIAETYPTIRLQLPANGHLDEFGNKRDFFVLCSLHSYKESKADVHRSLSPHLLMARRRQTPSYEFILAPMQEIADQPLERSWQLQDFVIVRLKPGNFQQSLLEKQRHCDTLQLPKVFERLKGDLDLRDDSSIKASGLLNVCLGFTIYEKDFYANEYRLYKETIYSDNIFHGDDLRIHELCNTKGPIAGGTKIHIMIKLPSGYQFTVHMFKFSNDMSSMEWEEFVPITDQNIFCNAAITYILPPGPPNAQTDEVEVMIEIVVGQSSYKSRPVKFWYLNTNENVEGPRKQARRHAIRAASDESQSAIDPNLMHNIPYSISVAGDPLPEESVTNLEENVIDMNFMNLDNQPPDPDILSFSTEFELQEFLESLLGETVESSSKNKDDTSEPLPYYSQDRCEMVKTKKEKIMKEKSIRRVDISTLIKRRIDRILNGKLNAADNDETNIKGLNGKSGTTIFHIALMDMDLLIYLYRQQKKSPHLKQLIQKARNANRQNLLHYACVLNKESCIRPLVGMGVALNEQDSLGRTPLHIAIEHNNQTCLKKIHNLLEDHSNYPAEVERQLIQMFQVYNHKGYTVLHAAAIQNCYDLVEVMLKFCTAHQIDILSYEALGSGDSIAHLIARRNLVDMIGLIRQYVPQCLSEENYRGQTVLTLQGLSDEMLAALKQNSDLSEMIVTALNIQSD